MGKSSKPVGNSDIGTMPDNGASRQVYDLSHYSMMVGAIGGLQTLTTIPVVPGDSFDLDFSAVFRLSPLRRNMYLDARVDLFAFFVPHRHVYTNWVDFIKDGYDEGVTLGTDTIPSGDIHCLGRIYKYGHTMPRYISRGYMMIWNRYFRDPSETAIGELAEDYLITTAAQKVRDYGMKCCWLPRIWNTAVTTNLAAADYEYTVAGSVVDLFEFEKLKARLRTEQARNWFAVRYQDVLNYTYGTRVNIDADERPELLMRSASWLSGRDVEGTDTSTLGTYTGKGVSVAGLRMPPKMFMEHGTIWLQALVRFPSVLNYENHYLDTHPEPTYKEISGDPAVILSEKPISVNKRDFVDDASSITLGEVPYAQWYREQPSAVHNKYHATEGHQFITESDLSSKEHMTYIDQDHYDDVFQTTQLKHWNSQGFVDITAKRFIPHPVTSIFAGSK